MRPVYAMRLDGPVWPAAQTDAVRRIVTEWVENEYPFEEREAGISVRVDNDQPERWWRLSVDRGLPGNSVATTTVTVASDDKVTTFETRVVLVPGGRRVAPSSNEVSVATVQKLVARVLETTRLYDANQRVLAGVRLVSESMAAQEVAAFCDAKGRLLPVLVETVPTRSTPLYKVESIGLRVAGQAHLYRLDGDAARTAFHGMYGLDVLNARGLTLFWPGREVRRWGGSKVTAIEAEHELRECLGLVNEAAHGSLAPLRSPAFSRRPREPKSSESITAATTPSTPAGSTSAPAAVPTTETSDQSVAWTEYSAALEGWQEAYNRIDELEQALAEADRTIDEKNQLLENREGLVDQLVQRNVALEIRLGKRGTELRATSAADAVAKARDLCRHLTFHERAIDTAAHLEGINADRLLEDLVRLDVVAGDWKSGRITNASLTISCRSLGLNYAGGISDTAERKFSDDYAFTWRGRTEYAVAHIRNGKGASLYRVHVFFDNETQQVVVVHVGRHLRDKSSS